MSDKCKVIVSGIKWDTDGESIPSLPEQVAIDIPRDMANEADISEWLTSCYGFCHFGFVFTIVAAPPCAA